MADKMAGATLWLLDPQDPQRSHGHAHLIASMAVMDYVISNWRDTLDNWH